MIRTLVLIAVTGFILSIVFLGGAFMIGGPEAVARGAWGWGWRHDDHGWRGSWHEMSDDSPEVTRELTWSGGDRLEFGIPAEVRYVQAAGPAKLVVTGPQGLVDRLRVDHGEIGFKEGHFWSRGRTLQIVLTAPGVRNFGMSGSGKLTVEGFDQDEFSLNMSGSGEAQVSGRARTAHLDISGSGEADLSGLKAQGAEVNVTGSGQARIDAAEWARLDISGSGDVELARQPKRLESDVSGSGRVYNVAPSAPQAPEPPKPPKAV